MKILITGDSGLLGYHLAQELVKDHSVYGISRSERNQVPGVVRHHIDLRNQKDAYSVISRIRPEIVFHLAANAAEGKSLYSPIDITENGVNVFYNTLVPAINAGALKRVVFTSSIAVYGSIHVPFREQDMPIPQDIYGIQKLSTEHALRALAKVHGFEHVIVRPHNVYGEGQNMSDPYRNVVMLFMNQILKKEPYVIYGDGKMRRCFSYVKDVVDIIVKSGFEDVSGMTFNVGSDTDYSINDLSNIIQQITGSLTPPHYIRARKEEVHTAVADHTLVKKVFGYSDTSLQEGLRRSWEWCKRQGAQEYIYSTLEIEADHAPDNWK